MHFSQIKKSDLVCVDDDGYVIDGIGAQKPVNTAGVHIHKELHKARPDIKAACHAHSIYGMLRHALWFDFRQDMVHFWKRTGYDQSRYHLNSPC
jgi:ribulose-5-phosphate 4-epimerase/fuculose-1-phosphate aldolase